MFSFASKLWCKFAPQVLKREIDRRILYSNLPSKRRRKHYPSGVPVIAGFLQSGFGVAQAARLEVDALRQGGIQFDLIDLSAVLNNKDMKDPLYTSTPCPSPHGLLLLHVNPPELRRSLHFIGKSQTADRPVVGVWAWELPQPPPYWHLAYPCLDELWVPSSYVAETFRGSCPVPLRVVPHPVRKPVGGGLQRSNFELPESTCLFLVRVGFVLPVEENVCLVR